MDVKILEQPYKPGKVPIVDVVNINDLDVYTETWSVPNGVEIKGFVLIIHGFAEFSNLYYGILDFLSNNGYECLFFDQRGAGRTSQGKLKGVTNDAILMSDIDELISLKVLPKLETIKNFYLVGHSMGGGIILSYLISGKYNERIRGAVTVGPLFYNHPKTDPNFILKLGLKFTFSIIGLP